MDYRFTVDSCGFDGSHIWVNRREKETLECLFAENLLMEDEPLRH